MPIVRIDEKGNKRAIAKKVAACVVLGTLAGILTFCFHDRDVGLLVGVISSSIGSVWSLVDE